MKIIYLHQYFKTPAMAGGTRSFEMARRLADAGHEVHVITGRSTPDAMRRRGIATEQVEGFTVHWVPVDYNNTLSFGGRVRAFAAYGILASIRAMRVPGDVVFATSTPLTVAVPAVVAKWKQRIPMVFEVRDLWPEMPIAVGALRNPLLRRLARTLERVAYRNATSIIALSPGMAEGVNRVTECSRPVHMIPNSCDNDLFDVPQQAGLDFRAARPWLGDAPLVVYCGTFGSLNGVDYLVLLANELRDIDPEVRILAVGGGSKFQDVRALAERTGVLGLNFFLEERIPKMTVPALLSAADVATSLFVPVKEMEVNSANKFFDALAAGRPVAINYGGWQADMIRDEGLGVVLDPYDARRSASELAALLRDEGRRAEMHRNARRVASTVFDRDRLAEQLRDVLEQVVRTP